MAMGFFSSVRYHISPSLTPEQRELLKHLLLNNGAEPAEGVRDATHIITNSDKFEGWQSVGQDAHVVTEKWVERSLLMGKVQPPQFYSAKPADLFSGVVACATEIPIQDLEVLSAGILAMGGQWRTGLTKEVTHLFAIAPSSAKYDTALKLQEHTGTKVVLPHWYDDVVRLGSARLDTRPYEWPEPELLKNRNLMKKEEDGEEGERERKVKKAMAVESDPMKRSVYTTAARYAPVGSSELSIAPPPPPPAPHALVQTKQVWDGRRILLSRNLLLFGSRREAVEVGIRRAGGEVVRWDGDEDVDPEGTSEVRRKRNARRRGRAEAGAVEGCDIYISRWREGRAYVKAYREEKTIGTLAWLYHVQATGTVTRPLDQLLHYPVPERPIEGFRNHYSFSFPYSFSFQFCFSFQYSGVLATKLDANPTYVFQEITITNYTGEAREYLKKLIMVMGARFTASMSAKNTVLIAASKDGTKSTKALSWSIPIINHTWLEDCFAQWQPLTYATEKYVHFPQGVDFAGMLGERGIVGGVSVGTKGEGEGKKGEEGEGKGVGVGERGGQRKEQGGVVHAEVEAMEEEYEAEDLEDMEDLGEDEGEGIEGVKGEGEGEEEVLDEEDERDVDMDVDGDVRMDVDLDLPIAGARGAQRKRADTEDVDDADADADEGVNVNVPPMGTGGSVREVEALVDGDVHMGEPAPLQDDDDEPPLPPQRSSVSPTKKGRATPGRTATPNTRRTVTPRRTTTPNTRRTTTPKKSVPPHSETEDEDEEEQPEPTPIKRGRGRPVGSTKREEPVAARTRSRSRGPRTRSQSRPRGETASTSRANAQEKERVTKANTKANARSGRRGRSASRSRVRSQSRGRGRSYSRGRGRGRGRETEDEDEDEDEEDGRKRGREKKKGKSRGRSYSRGRGRRRRGESLSQSEVEVDDDEEEDGKDEDGSESEDDGRPKRRRKGAAARSRSMTPEGVRKRVVPYDFNTEDEEEEKEQEGVRLAKSTKAKAKVKAASRAEKGKLKEKEKDKDKKEKLKEKEKEKAKQRKKRSSPSPSDSEDDEIEIVQDLRPTSSAKRFGGKARDDDEDDDDDEEKGEEKSDDEDDIVVVKKGPPTGRAKTKPKEKLPSPPVLNDDSDEDLPDLSTVMTSVPKKDKPAPAPAPAPATTTVASTSNSASKTKPTAKSKSTADSKSKSDSNTKTKSKSEATPQAQPSASKTKPDAKEKGKKPVVSGKEKEKGKERMVIDIDDDGEDEVDGASAMDEDEDEDEPPVPPPKAKKTAAAPAPAPAPRRKSGPAQQPPAPPAPAPRAEAPVVEIPTHSRRAAAAKASAQLRDVIMPDVMNFENQMRKSRKSGAGMAGFVVEGDTVKEGTSSSAVVGGKRKKGEGKQEEEEKEKTREKAKEREREKEEPMDVDGDEKKAKRRKVGGGKSEEKEVVQEKRVIKIATTQVVMPDDVAKTLAKLGATVTAKPLECTHLLAAGVVRTEKFLCAIANGAYILRKEWATDSAKAGKILPEANYVLKDPGNKHGVDLPQSLERSRNGKLFAGKTFYVAGKTIASTIPLLKNVVAASGGQLREAQKLTQRVIAGGEERYAVSSPDDISLWRQLGEAGTPVYSVELIIAGTLKQTFDPESARLEWSNDS